MNSYLVRAPRSRKVKWATYCASGLIVLAVVGIASLWTLPAALTPDQASQTSQTDYLDTVNDVRGTLITFLVAAGAITTVLFTARTYDLGRRGYQTDRYIRAVTLLGSEAPDAKLGGLYALEQAATWSPHDRDTIIRVLGAFIRANTQDNQSRTTPPPEHVAVALGVAGRLLPSSEIRFNLERANIRGSDLSRWNSRVLDRTIWTDAKVAGVIWPPGFDIGTVLNQATP